MRITALTFILLTSAAAALEPYATFRASMIDESSGLVKSRQYPGVYWTHNDSGDKARLFGIRHDGSLIQPNWYLGKYPGVLVHNAVNIDWEDITTDGAGNLAIGAFGNNDSDRTDLSIYILPEPNPADEHTIRATRQIRFSYPDQLVFPPEKKNYDAEALFYAYGKYHILSKHWSDTDTTLYRFDSMKDDQLNVLSLVQTFPIGGMVTAADFDPERQLLAVLTYSSIWLFETTEDSLLGGKNYRYVLKNQKQCEAICFDGDNILFTNEEGELFTIPITTVIEESEKKAAAQ